MTKDTLGYIDALLTGAGVRYQLGRWEGPVEYPYFVGEYAVGPVSGECGQARGTLTLTGFQRGDLRALEEAAAAIEGTFADRRQVFASGMGVSVTCAGARMLPSRDDGLRRMEIDLTITEWRVN